MSRDNLWLNNLDFLKKKSEHIRTAKDSRYFFTVIVLRFLHCFTFYVLCSALCLSQRFLFCFCLWYIVDLGCCCCVPLSTLLSLSCKLMLVFKSWSAATTYIHIEVDKCFFFSFCLTDIVCLVFWHISLAQWCITTKNTEFMKI